MKRIVYRDLKRRAVLSAVITSLAIFFLLAFSCDSIKTAVSSESLPIKAENKKILFVGDTSFGESYSGTLKVLKMKGYDYPVDKLAPLLRGSDLVIANLETPITDIKESPFKDSKAYCHWTHVEKAPYYFKKYNMHTFALANNHILDFGIPGLEQTFKIMKENDIEWFGAGLTEKEAADPFMKTFSFGEKKLKLAVISAFEYRERYATKYNFYAKGDQGGAYRLSTKKIGKQIKNLKTKDPETFVVIFPHWGKNYRWKTDRQTMDAHQFIIDGADLVIGHGGHSMQEIEQYNDRWIIYGLGNFVFLSPGRYAQKNALPYSYVAQLIVDDLRDKIQKRIRLYPIFSDNRVSDFQPRPLTDEEFEQFVAKLLEKSPLETRQQKQARRGKNEIGNYVDFPI